MAANSLTPHKNAAANPLAARGLEAADREPAPLDASSAQPHSPRAWQRMLSGRRLDLLAPSPTDVEISDIAHGLARVARWNGQTIGDHAFSVAQHALLVERITHDLAPDWPKQWRLAALLHDAAEYVVGDLISPFKNAIGLDYRALEHRLLAAIHTRFDLPTDLPAQIAQTIKSADRISAFFEATELAGFSRTEAEHYFGHPTGLSASLAAQLTPLKASPPAEAQLRFIARFDELT